MANPKMNGSNPTGKTPYFGHAQFIVLLLLATGLEFTSSYLHAAKRRFTVADDIALAHFGELYTGEAAPITFSPDGSFFVVDTQRGLLDRNLCESTLWVFRTEDIRRFLLNQEAKAEPLPIWTITRSTYKEGPIITNIRWLPDSSGVAFLEKKESGSEQLMLADVRSKTIDVLTPADQNVTAFDIRDRNRFAYSVPSSAIRQRAIAENQANRIVGTGRSLNSLLFAMDSRDTSKLYDLSELWVVVNGGRIRVGDSSSSRPLALYRAGQSVLALSPDGRSIVTALPVSTVPSEWEAMYPPSLPTDPVRIRPGWQNVAALEGKGYVSEYVLISVASGSVKPLANAPLGEAAGWSGALGADWSSDGNSVVLSNTFVPPSPQGLAGERNRPCIALVSIEDGHLSCLERLKGKAKNETGYEDGFHFVDAVHFERGSSERIRVDYWPLHQYKTSESYVRSDSGFWRIETSAKGGAAENPGIEIDVKESLNDPPVLVATDKSTKASRIILDPNPQLKDIELGEASVLKWKDENGREWVGGLYKPPDYVPGRRYPLVVQTHGFSELIFRPDGIFPTAFAARELAAVGMLVVQVPDCPFTVNPEEASCNVAGYEAVVKELVAAGLADRNGVGIIGFSRTCFYVLATLTSSKLHVRAASISDGFVVSYLQYITSVDSGENGVAHESDGIIGAPPFGGGLQEWVRRSPDFRMDEIQTPLQVTASGSQSLLAMWEPYAVLRYLNKPVDLVVLNSYEHVLSNPAERMVSQGGTVDWFRFWLKGEEDPDPAKAEQYARWRELRKLQGENDKKAAKEKTNGAPQRN
jgi:dipeptidyl aminopeptidase/acylaminoacyl peptidase